MPFEEKQQYMGPGFPSTSKWRSSKFLKQCKVLKHLFHSGYFYYSASSSPLLLRGAPDAARIPCRSVMPKSHRQLLRVKDFAQGPYEAAGAGFEPATLRMKGESPS